MKVRTLCAGLLAAGVVAMPGIVSSGLQGGLYAITWDSIAAGGGGSSGGPFEVVDTVGQTNAGPAMNGGPFTIQDGFHAFDVKIAEPLDALVIY